MRNKTNNTPVPAFRTQRRRQFPQRLYDMLEKAEELGYDHVISWMPDGKSFKIHVDGTQDAESEKAVVDILKGAFNQTRYRSFLRQLQLYGFERTCRGPHKGECRHDLLVRGERNLLEEKSIQDFQPSDCNQNNSNTYSYNYDCDKPGAGCVQQSLSPPPDSMNIESSCEYAKTSLIPTKLYNLRNRKHRHDTKSCDKENENDSKAIRDSCIPTPEDKPELPSDTAAASDDHDDDLETIISSDDDINDIDDWTGFELEMLRKKPV